MGFLNFGCGCNSCNSCNNWNYCQCPCECPCENPFVIFNGCGCGNF